jgi:hypothetical protein
MPYLALQLAPRILLYQTLALALDFISLFGHPFIGKCMFSSSNGAISNILGKDSGIFEDLSFGDLWKTSFRIDAKHVFSNVSDEAWYA